MNDFLLNMGFSWTWAKALPYLFFLLMGIVVYLAFRARFKRRVWKISFGVVVLVPIGIYFAFNPIYEGDFSNNFRVEASNKMLRSNELTVIAIPNCPFCAESTERLNRIAERTEVERINFIVLTADPEALTYYKGIVNDKIHVTSDSIFDNYAKLTQSHFPTFIYVKGGSARIWSNDGFGAGALDWLEEQLRS